MAAPEPAELKKFTGLQRAAAVMLALGKEGGAEVWKQLSLPEVKELSAAVAGTIDRELGRCVCTVEQPDVLLVTFATADAAVRPVDPAQVEVAAS